MDIQPVFGTPLITATLHDARLHAEIAAAITAAAAAPSAGEVPGGGWRSGPLPQGWGGAAGTTLANSALALARQHSVDIAGDGRDRFGWRCDLEALLLPPGARTLPGFAPAAFWSAIYCVEATADVIELEDPRSPLILLEAPSLRFAAGPTAAVEEPVQRLRAVAGQLLMFPGWLRRAHGPGAGRRMFLHLDLVALPRD
jgi:hypothetical protein